MLLKPRDHFFNCLSIMKTINEIRIYVRAIASISFFLKITTRYNFNNWQIKLLSKFIVTLIMTRYSHDCTSAITS
ncbi:hypothetical protein D3C77_381500 [compost metagenome]